MPQATIRQCAILAGGLGTRLGAITATTPKPILDIGGRPFLFWLMRELQRFGVEEFLLLTGHLSSAVEAAVRAVAAALPRPASLRFSVEPMPAGTGGALHYAAPLLDPRFLLCNGDSLFDTNLAMLLAAAASEMPGRIGHMLLRRVADASRYGVVSLAGDCVAAFHERPPSGTPGIINTGIYVFERAILAHVAPICSLEREVLPVLASLDRLGGTIADGYFIDIGVPEDLARARAELAARLIRPAVFFDRDGVLNVDHGHVGTRDRWDWVPGALDAIRLVTQSGRHAFIVTNQSGVARGFYNEHAVLGLLGWVGEEARRSGGTIDDFRYCPHHPDAGKAPYRGLCACRKPAPGMLRDLIGAWGLDPGPCLMIGDKETDLLAASGAGVPGHLFPGGRLDAFLRQRL